jgi:hypothetical protein
MAVEEILRQARAERSCDSQKREKRVILEKKLNEAAILQYLSVAVRK